MSAWDEDAAEKFLQNYADTLAADVKHIRRSAESAAFSEEELFLFLTQGLGWEEEEAEAKASEFRKEG